MQKRYFGLTQASWIFGFAPPVVLTLNFIIFLVFGSIPNLKDDWIKILWSIFALSVAGLTGWIVGRLIQHNIERDVQQALDRAESARKNWDGEHT